MSRDNDRGLENWFHNHNAQGQTLAEELAEMVKEQEQKPRRFVLNLKKKPFCEIAIRLGAPDLATDELDYQLDKLERFSEKVKD